MYAHYTEVWTYNGVGLADPTRWSLCTLWSRSWPRLIVLEHVSTNKEPLPQKTVEWSILFLGTLNHLQLCTTSDNFTQLPTELRTTALQLTFSHFFYFHNKPRLLIQIVCTCKTQTLCMRILVIIAWTRVGEVHSSLISANTQFPDSCLNLPMATYNRSLHAESKMAVENVELKEQYWNTGR